MADELGGGTATMEVGSDVSGPSDLSFEGLDSGSGSSGTDASGSGTETSSEPEFDFGEPDPGLSEPESTEEAQAETTEEAVPATEEAPPVEEASATEDLPDGVQKGKDRNGKPGYFLQENRYKQFHQAHQTLRELGEIAGQPLTADVLDGFQRAHLAQEKLYGDLLSADPVSQGKVIEFWMQEALQAQQNGEVGSDPIETLADVFYDKIEAHHPMAYAKARDKYAKALIQEVYGEAQRTKNPALFKSAGWISKALNLPYKKESEMVGFFNSPIQNQNENQILRENQELKAQLAQRTQSSQESSYQTWESQTNQGIAQAVLSQGVLPELEEVSKLGLWAKDPKAFQEHVVSPLHKAVNDVVMKDSKLRERVQLLVATAKRSTPQRRIELAQEAQQLFSQRARLATEALKQGILRDAAKRMSAANGDLHAKRALAAAKSSPPNGSPVKRSLVPRNSETGQWETATHENLMSDLKGLLR